MKKKLVATLLVGVIAAAGVIGFTACNNGGNNNEEEGGVPKGEQVTEAQWKSAIAATAAAENFTATMSMERKTEGTKQDDSSVKVTYYNGQSSKMYVDIASKKYYMDFTETNKSSGGEAIGETDVDTTTTNYMCNVAEGTKLWQCTNLSEASGWTAYADDLGTEAAVTQRFSSYKLSVIVDDENLSTTADGEETTLSNLYSAFKHEDGFYTATLYGLGMRDQALNVTVSLKNDYVTSFGYKIVGELTDDGFNITDTTTMTYTFSAYGSTTVNIPAEALAAIEAAKTPSNALAGKTFVFGNLDFQFDSSITLDEEEQILQTKPQLEAMYANTKVIFGTDGDFQMLSTVMGQSVNTEGTYKIDGNSVVLTPVTANGEPMGNDAQPETFTFTDDTLSMSIDTEQGFIIIMNFVLQA